MKKSINFWSFAAGTTVEEAIRLAKDAGFAGIELSMGEVGLMGLPTTDIIPTITMNTAMDGPMADIIPALSPLRHFSRGKPIRPAVEKARRMYKRDWTRTMTTMAMAMIHTTLSLAA